jgi:hypothetical protein
VGVCRETGLVKQDMLPDVPAAIGRRIVIE